MEYYHPNDFSHTDRIAETKPKKLLDDHAANVGKVVEKYRAFAEYRMDQCRWKSGPNEEVLYGEVVTPFDARRNLKQQLFRGKDRPHFAPPGTKEPRFSRANLAVKMQQWAKSKSRQSNGPNPPSLDDLSGDAA